MTYAGHTHGYFTFSASQSVANEDLFGMTGLLSKLLQIHQDIP
jgi:hypothetical protein